MTRQATRQRQQDYILEADPADALRRAADMLAPIPKASPLVRYWYDPAAFVDDFVLGLTLTPYQREILDQIPIQLSRTVHFREQLPQETLPQETLPKGPASKPHGDPAGFSNRKALDYIDQPYLQNSLDHTTSSPPTWGGPDPSRSQQRLDWASLHPLYPDRPGRDWKGVTTASNGRHLTEYLWPEIRKWASPRGVDWERLGRPPLDNRTELLRTMLHLQHGQAFAASPVDPSAIEGAHADYMLYIIDEAKSVKDEVWDAIEGALSGADVTARLCIRGPHGLGKTALVSSLLIWYATTREDMCTNGLGSREAIWSEREALCISLSTPGGPTGKFYSIQMQKPGFERWWTRFVRLREALQANRIKPIWVEQSEREWGRESALFQNRVLGEFATDAEDGVIPLAWAEEAIARESPSAQLKATLPVQAMAADIARQGQDRNAIAALHAWEAYFPVEAWHSANTMEVTGRIIQEWSKHAADKPKLAVDVIGIGAGVVDRLREQGYEVVAFSGSESPGGETDKSGELKFLNLRAVSWWRVREMLDPTGWYVRQGILLKLPDDDELLGELCTPRYETRSNGVIKVESKDEIRARLGRSPDKADAVVMAIFLATARAFGVKPTIRTLGSSEDLRDVARADNPLVTDTGIGTERPRYGAGSGGWKRVF